MSLELRGSWGNKNVEIISIDRICAGYCFFAPTSTNSPPFSAFLRAPGGYLLLTKLVGFLGSANGS